MATVADRLLVELVANTKQLEFGLRRSQRQINRFGKNSNRALRSLDNTFKRLGQTVVTFGASLAASLGGAKLVGTIADFEQQISTLRAVTGATVPQVKLLETVIRRLGSSTPFTASQVAAAADALARSGFTIQEVAKTLPGVLNLALAGGISIADAAQITAAAINIFKLETEDATRVADVLATAQSRSATNVLELGEAFKLGGADASQYKLSIEEAAAAIGVLSNAGIRGGEAGTGLRQFLTETVELANTTNARQINILENLGIDQANLNASKVGLDAVLQELSPILESDDRASIFNQLFSRRAAGRVAILIEQRANLKLLRTELNASTGSAERMGRIMDENLQGAIKRVSSAFEGMILAMNEVTGFSTRLSNFLDSVSSVLQEITANAQRAAIAVEFLGAALLALPFVRGLRGIASLFSSTGYLDLEQRIRSIPPFIEPKIYGNPPTDVRDQPVFLTDEELREAAQSNNELLKEIEQNANRAVDAEETVQSQIEETLTSRRDLINDIQTETQNNYALANALAISNDEYRKVQIRIQSLEQLRSAELETNEENIQAIIEANTQLQKSAERLERLQEIRTSIQSTAQSISNSFTTAFSNIVAGTQSVSNAFRAMVANIINELIRLHFQRTISQPIAGLLSNSLSALFGSFTSGNVGGTFNVGNPVPDPLAVNIPGRQYGGAVTANRPYIVGERGAELFIPNQSGSVAPSGATINVYQNIQVADSQQLRAEIDNVQTYSEVLATKVATNEVARLASKGGAYRKAFS